MATVSKWTPFGVALNITATGGTVTRTSATQFTVKINASWETYWSSSKTDYGMTASSGGGSVTLNKEGTKSAGSSGSFTGTYSISGNGSATKTITVTFKNFNTYHGDSATKSVSFDVSVPAWTSYKVTYYPNGGSGTTYTQTKWKNQSLTIATLATTKFARTGYSFLGWSTSSTATSPNGSYDPGDKYTGNANLNLYAVWKPDTYKVTYNANDNANGSDVSNLPSAQTKTYDKPLTLSSTVPKRTNYTFKGWGTSASTTTVAYKPGESYTANAGITLYAIWELAYKKPTITSVSVYRCNGSATADENGTFAHVEFNWTCFLEDPTITIAWKTASGSGSSDVHNATGTSGTMSTTVGNDALTTESTYTFQITVADSNGSTTVSKILSGKKFAIDFLAGASGAAIGKPAEVSGYLDVGYKTRFRDIIQTENNTAIYGFTPNGERVEVINPINTNNNTVIGWGNYTRGEGNTHVYGHDISFAISNIANFNADTNTGFYRPYLRRGDSFSLSIRTAGYVTNSGKDVSFVVPITMPIIGSPTVTASSNDGFALRQGNSYTHGSSATVYVKPDSYRASLNMRVGVYITASFSDVTNVTNNDAIGIYWSGTITFT